LYHDSNKLGLGPSSSDIKALSQEEFMGVLSNEQEFSWLFDIVKIKNKIKNESQ